ncbi:MAG: phospholipase D/transphosphatidylase, partial [Rhodospirillales bacterium]|nr:phospholipase D/transphosphatidylase [Rhodospirillales bacterium]
MVASLPANRQRKRAYPSLLTLKIIASGCFLLALALGAVRLFNPLPPIEPRAVSYALADTGETPLGRGAARAMSAQPGLSGIHLLNDGRSAFAVRAMLARAAVRSLDVQYYIWHGDLSGTLLLEEVRVAAERGVRVRLLLDDNGTRGLDVPLAALDAHPNIEVRLFNPIVLRWPRMLGLLIDPFRLNRRMHNKSFTVDNQVTVVGGRNVGDEYFGARDSRLFMDLDALAVGPVVREVSTDFDRYWNSASAYPVARILPAVPRAAAAEIAAAARNVRQDAAAAAYINALSSLPIVEALRNGTLELTSAPVGIVSDDPVKALGAVPRGRTLWSALTRAIGAPRRKLRLVSGYFVPTDAGVDALASLSQAGVEVAVLTNALRATDVPLVHAGYAGYRVPLLRAGIRLFELSGVGAAEAAAPASRRVIGAGSDSGGSSTSSGSALHAKTFVVDGDRLFVGLFNFDPRSHHLNTELGFVIESPALAQFVDRGLGERLPDLTYEVRLETDGNLVWLERRGGEVIRHRTEPGTSLRQRVLLRLLSY